MDRRNLHPITFISTATIQREVSLIVSKEKNICTGLSIEENTSSNIPVRQMRYNSGGSWAQKSVTIDQTRVYRSAYYSRWFPHNEKNWDWRFNTLFCTNIWRSISSDSVLLYNPKLMLLVLCITGFCYLQRELDYVTVNLLLVNSENIPYEDIQLKRKISPPSATFSC